MSTHGRCDCGAVSYEVTGPLRDVLNCHCKRCQRFTGHHMAATAAHPDQVSFESDATLSWYEPAPGVFYGFCRQCGSSLFWKADAHRDKIAICAGALEGPTGLRTVAAWWVADAGDYFVRDASITEHQYES